MLKYKLILYILKANHAGAKAISIVSERSWAYFNNITFINNFAESATILLAYENFNDFGAVTAFFDCKFESNIGNSELISVTDTTLLFVNCSFKNHIINLMTIFSSFLKMESIRLDSIRFYNKERK